MDEDETKSAICKRQARDLASKATAKTDLEETTEKKEDQRQTIQNCSPGEEVEKCSSQDTGKYLVIHFDFSG